MYLRAAHAYGLKIVIYFEFYFAAVLHSADDAMHMQVEKDREMRNFLRQYKYRE